MRQRCRPAMCNLVRRNTLVLPHRLRRTVFPDFKFAASKRAGSLLHAQRGSSCRIDGGGGGVTWRFAFRDFGSFSALIISFPRLCQRFIRCQCLNRREIRVGVNKIIFTPASSVLSARPYSVRDIRRQWIGSRRRYRIVDALICLHRPSHQGPSRCNLLVVHIGKLKTAFCIRHHIDPMLVHLIHGDQIKCFRIQRQTWKMLFRRTLRRQDASTAARRDKPQARGGCGAGPPLTSV